MKNNFYIQNYMGKYKMVYMFNVIYVTCYNIDNIHIAYVNPFIFPPKILNGEIILYFLQANLSRPPN